MTPDSVADLLRRAIRERVFQPGQELMQDELATRLGVSRIPLPEALRMLAAEAVADRGAQMSEATAPSLTFAPSKVLWSRSASRERCSIRRLR